MNEIKRSKDIKTLRVKCGLLFVDILNNYRVYYEILSFIYLLHTLLL